MAYPCAEPQPSTTAPPSDAREPSGQRPVTDGGQDTGESIIVVGPDPTEVGGMASVVGQMLAMSFGHRYRPAFLPMTFASSNAESVWQRVSRHLGQIRKLTRLIRTERAPIVHLHTCSGASFYRSLVDMWIARRAGARTVLHIHGAKFDAFFENASPMHRRVIRWGLEKAGTVIALSQQWLETIRQMAPLAKIVVVENSVALPPQDQRRPSPEPCRFLLLAKMDIWKGIDDLLDACVLLLREGTSIELTLAGPPGTAGNAEELAGKIASRSLASRVIYVGPVHGADKENLLNHTDVYIQPSHHEGMPIAILEALAHGLPVVATQVGAIPEVISNGKQGLTVPAKNVSMLAEAMSRVAADENLRIRMGIAARTLAERRFSTARFETDMAAIYDDLTKPNSSSIAVGPREVKPVTRPKAVAV